MKPVFQILVVDDDLLLIEILNRAALVSFPEATFIQVYSATEATAYVKNLNGYGPKLVLLDLDLGDRTDGLGFLTFLRAHVEARFLPVVMLTLSKLPHDIEISYSIGASSFTVKPFSYAEWQIYLGALRLYWFETVSLPRIRFHKEPV